MQDAGYFKTPKQCRERWAQHLDPSLSTLKWTPEENRLLLQLQATHGNKWKDIAVNFPKRTDNGIKNQFFSLIRKSIRRAFKASEVAFSSNLINNLKPKVLSDFLNLDLTVTQGLDKPPADRKVSVRYLVERFTFSKMGDIAGKLNPVEKELVNEVLKKLKTMK